MGQRKEAPYETECYRTAKRRCWGNITAQTFTLGFNDGVNSRVAVTQRDQVP